MKGIFKIIIIIVIAVLLFGGVTIKNWMHQGTELAVDTIEKGIDNVKNSEIVDNLGSELKSNVRKGINSLIPNN